VPVGRLIFTVNALPTMRPMNCALVDELIVLRTAAATVARKVNYEIVAFQADDLDAGTSGQPCEGRRAGVKIGSGCPPAPVPPWDSSPSASSEHDS